MIWRAMLMALAILCAQPFPAVAQIDLDEKPLEDPAAEARARALMAELRCLTCQNQSIADSNAPQAQTMRVEVRERIAAGEKPEAIRRWFIERYGDWVSFSPPARGDTMLLWAAPLLFLAIGLVLLARRIR